MGTKVYLSTLGRPVAPEDAKVSVFDRGFLFGDSVYETMRTVGGRLLDRERHLDRLRNSARALGFAIPYSDEEIDRVFRETHGAAENAESYVRVIVTRGIGPIMLDPRQSGEPAMVVIVAPLVLPSHEAVERGVHAVVVDVHKTAGTLIDPTIKSGNYLNNILALRRALAGGAEEALLCRPDGVVTEGSTSNIFIVRGGRLQTPHLEIGLLPGITRIVVWELAQEMGIAVEGALLRPEDVRAADEVFLTSSVRGIMPVRQIDDEVVGGGQMGPLTRKIRDAYEDRLERLARGG